MMTLPKNWITEGLIDFEFKKYQLLSYLQETNKQFKALKLYPVLAELIEHHRLLDELQKGKTDLKNLFPKALTSIDLENLQLNYQPKVHDDEIMKEITLISEFSLPKFSRQIEEGKTIYNYVEEQVEFEPVGIQPIYNKEGFIFLSTDLSKEVYAFRYKLNLLQMAGENFRSITVWLLGVYQRTLVNTLEKLKMQLIREIRELPNPATWRLHSRQDFPIEETLLPISKRLLLQAVSI
jgi:hypothetical protein